MPIVKPNVRRRLAQPFFVFLTRCGCPILSAFCAKGWGVQTRGTDGTFPILLTLAKQKLVQVPSVPAF